MALFNLYRIRLGNVGVGNYVTNNRVLIQWNDSTNDFQVDTYDDSEPAVFIATETSGPDLTVDDYVASDYQYQFCDSSTLVTFGLNPTLYPYAYRINTANHTSCVAGHVCDILIQDYDVVNASTSTSTDGEIQVLTVTGTDTPFSYSLDNFVTSQTSTTFTGLAAGNYILYAKDTYGCIDLRDVTVGYDSTYGVRYRLEFDAFLAECPFSYRVDILERDYAGAVDEIKGTTSPFVLHYQGENEDKFKQIIASKAVLGLIAESNLYYVDLFSGDDRQFLVKFYIDEGSGNVLEWQGYVLQESYEESYGAPPYDVTFYATDGLADLANVQYGDGNVAKGSKSLISIIASCLSSTDLDLSIRSAINRFETTQTQAAGDDPLAQTYFDTYFLNGMTKKEVLEEMLKSFGARIIQSGGYWWIISIEDTVSSSLPYRQFDSAGVYVSNSSASPRIDINYPDNTSRLAWNGTPLLRIKTGYKEVTITHDLGLVNNIFYTGRFHIDDYIEQTGLFRDIGVDILNAPGSTFGLQTIRGGNSDHAFYIDFTNAATGTLNFPQVYTLAKSIDNDYTFDSYKLKFDYFVNNLTGLFTRFDYKVKINTSYLQPDGSLSTDTDFQWVPIYVDKANYNTWQKFEIQFRQPFIAPTIQVFLRLYSNNSYDASSLSNFTNAALNPTVDLRIGDRRIALDNVAGVLFLRHYTLNYSDAATASPDILRPTDFNATTNPKVWYLDATTEYGGVQNNLVNYYLIDNLELQYLPDDGEPDTTNEYYSAISLNNKIPLEVDVKYGDLPGEPNDEHIYKNCFQLSDGSYTVLWGRSTTDEEIPLLDILALDLAGQYQLGTRFLNGSLVGDVTLRAHNCLIDNNDSDRGYMVLGMEADYAYNRYSVELTEIKSGATGPPSDTSGFTTGFSLGFRS